MPVSGEDASKMDDLREGIVWMEDNELMVEIAGAERQILRQVLRFVLSRGSVGEIECEASYQSDDHSGKK
jgi:hypothetical protein